MVELLVAQQEEINTLRMALGICTCAILVMLLAIISLAIINRKK